MFLLAPTPRAPFLLSRPPPPWRPALSLVVLLALTQGCAWCPPSLPGACCSTFDASYAGNRAPVGIFIHAASPLADPSHAEGLHAFLDYALAKPGVWAVTISGTCWQQGNGCCGKGVSLVVGWVWDRQRVGHARSLAW